MKYIIKHIQTEEYYSAPGEGLVKLKQNAHLYTKKEVEDVGIRHLINIGDIMIFGVNELKEPEVSKEDIFIKAIEKYGKSAQLKQLQEEATELALAARKMDRNGNDAAFENLVEEIGDVEIMIEQIELIFSSQVNFRGLVDQQKQMKIKRLQKRLEK